MKDHVEVQKQGQGVLSPVWQRDPSHEDKSEISNGGGILRGFSMKRLPEGGGEKALYRKGGGGGTSEWQILKVQGRRWVQSTTRI